MVALRALSRSLALSLSLGFSTSMSLKANMALFGGGEGGASPRTKKQKPAEIIERCVCMSVPLCG